MTEVSTVAIQIQQLEIYLNNLVSALTRGELPVNLKPITQIFDSAIASIPPTLNLPQDRFVELYNDLPQLFTAYAIDVTLSEDSYRRQTNDIIFHRFARGNYWIIPIESPSDRSWLVPNPLKGLSLHRMQSLDASFDRDILPNLSSNNCLLVTPALVQIAPIIEPLTWKLIERGKLTNSQIPQPTNPNSVIESLLERSIKLNDRVSQIDRESLKPEAVKILTDKQVQLQSIVTKLVEQLAINQPQLSSSSSTEAKEIVSLKIELEKLKTDYQTYQRQQDKNQRDLMDTVKALIATEIGNLQSVSPPKEIDTIDAEIIIPVQKAKPTQSSIDKVISPFARLYNSGKVGFLRSYMVSTVSLRKNSQKVELVENNTGLYWIVPFKDSIHYLVPKIDFSTNSQDLDGLALLFDGENDSTNFILFKPAIVSITKTSMPKQWKLEQKGSLDSNQ